MVRHLFLLMLFPSRPSISFLHRRSHTLSSLQRFPLLASVLFLTLLVVLAGAITSPVLAGKRPSPDIPSSTLPGFAIPKEELEGIAPRTNLARDGPDSLRWSHSFNFVSPLGDQSSLQVCLCVCVWGGRAGGISFFLLCD